MTTERLLALIQAQIPECPLYLASAYLLEMIETLKNNGSQGLVNLRDRRNRGYATLLPEYVLSVQKIYANGLLMGSHLSEDQAAYLLYTYRGYVLTDEDGYALTDDYGYALEI